MPRPKRPDGSPPHECPAPHCDHDGVGNGYCDMHRMRLKIHGCLEPETDGRGRWARQPRMGPLTFWQYYRWLHAQVAKKRGRASRCIVAFCNTGSTAFEWANISHEYRDVDDFMPMCAVHHDQHDGHASRLDAVTSQFLESGWIKELTA